jgi:hypothetical protein
MSGTARPRLASAASAGGAAAPTPALPLPLPSTDAAYWAAASAAFAAAFPHLTFTARSLDGRTVELVRGGAALRVTLASRHEYVAAAAAYHLTAYDPLLRHMRRGLYSVVPPRAVRVLTWQELEVAVAGKPEIDPRVLQANTDYEGYRRDDPTILMFWRVFETFTNEERALWVKFVWGRSRLPQGKRWRKKMKLTRRPGAPDSLPLAHTCFFSVELPEYSSEEVMRARLLAALHYGAVGIANA